MKDKIFMFIIGLLVGAIIASGAFYIYTKTINAGATNNPQMQGGQPPQMQGNQTGQPPEMPSSGNGQPPEMPSSENGQPPEKPSGDNNNNNGQPLAKPDSSSSQGNS